MRAFVTGDDAPQDAVSRINRALGRHGAHGRFVTLFIAVLDIGASKGVTRISAGNYGGKLGPHHYHLKELV